MTKIAPAAAEDIWPTMFIYVGGEGVVWSAPTDSHVTENPLRRMLFK